MVNRCTYLPDEFCLPKNSIIFSFYSLLSEINKISLNGHLITAEQKKELIRDLFLKKTVTKHSLKNYFKSKYGQDVLITTSNEKELEEIHTNLKSYQTFCNIFGEDYVRSHISQIDDIIRDITLFSDKKILKNRFKREYGIEDERILQKLSTLTYQGYGRLSKKLLTGITAPIADLNTGEVIEKNILQIMMDTNQNLMEILNNSEYPFRQMIEEEQQQERKDETIEEYVNRLYVSPGMKRPLIQAYRIIEELKTIIRHPIDSYYIECTRSNENKKERKDSRKAKLLQLYRKAMEICKKETEKSIFSIRDLKEKQDQIEMKEESEFRSDKLYLYYLQMGRCMYTNQSLSIEDVYNSAMCDVDHIIPQAILKDDSIENRVLVSKSANAYKSDRFPIPSNELFVGHRSFYKMLKECGFMGEKKYHNLLRSDELSSQELEQFVNRQLVYTNQAVSALVQMIRHFEHVAETDVVYSKAENVSHFRKQYDLLKSREANDFHHAHDAFLNIVVGRSLVAYYGFRMTGDKAKQYQSQNKTLNINKILSSRVIKRGDQIVWNGEETIAHVKKQIETRFDILMTTRQYIGHHLFEKVSLIPASKSKKDGLYPIKNPSDPSDIQNALKDTSKYGGYNNLANGYYCLVESEDKKGEKIVTIEAMQNIYVSPSASVDKKLKYLEEVKKLQKPKILHPLLRINFVLCDGKSKYCITGKTGDRLLIKNLNPMIIDKTSYRTIRKIEKLLNIVTKNKMDLSDPDKNGLSEKFPVCENQIIISPASNQDTKAIVLKEQEIDDLYQLLLQKMSAPIYENFSQFESLHQILTSTEKMNQYAQLSLYQKIFMMKEFLHLFQCNRVLSDLRLMDLSKNSGTLRISKVLKNQLIIQESVTGFYSKIIFDGKKR